MSSQTYRMSVEIDSSGAENKVSTLKSKLTELTGASKQLDDAFKKSSQNASLYQQAISKIDGVSGKVKQTLDRLKTTAKGAGDGVEQAGKDIKKAGNDAKDAQSKFDGLGQAFGRLKGLMLAGMAVAGVGSIVQTADAMKTLDGQIKIATGSAEKHAVAMNELERIAMANNVSLSSVGEMYVSNERALKQLGKSQSEVLKFTENVTQAMRLGGGSAEGQAAALTQLGQALASGVLRGDEFNSIAEQAPAIMDLLSQSLGVTTGELRKMAGDGKLTADVLYKAMTDAKATDKLKSMASQTSTTVQGALENVRTQWDLAVHAMMNSKGGLSDIIAGGILLVANGLQKVGDYLPTINQYISDVISKGKELWDSFSNSEFGQASFAVLKSAFDGLKDAIQGVIDIADGITTFLRENPEFAIALASGLTAAATAYFVITGAMSLFATVSTAVATAGGLAAMATTALGAAVAFLTSPITLTVAAIAALVAIGVYLYRNWDTIKAKASEVWNSVKETVSNAWESVKSSTLAKWEEIKQTASNKFEEVKNQIKEKFESIKQVFLSSPLGQIFATHFSVISTVAKSVFSAVQTVVRTAFGIIKGIVTGDVTAVKNAFSRGFNELKTIAKGAVDKVWGELKSLGGKLLQAGRDAVQGFINGFTEKMNAAYEKAREMASKVVSVVKSALDIHSPSREMKKLGKHTADGMAVGIEQNTPKAVKAAQKMADDIKKTVADSVANLKREIALFGNDSPIDALKYDISIGKYKGADTKELEALTAQKYALERNKVVLDEIDGIKEKIALVGKNELETLKYQLEHADKYKGISDDIKQSYLERTEALNQAVKAQERLSKVEAATADIAKNKHILANWQDKHAGLKYDLGKDGYDASQIEQIVQAEVVKEQVGKLQQLFSDISNKQVFAMPNITANFNSKGGGFDFVSQLLTQSMNLQTIIQEKRKQLDDALAQGLISEAEHYQQSEALTAQHLANKQALMQQATQGVLGGITSIMKNVYGEQSKHYKAAFVLEKAYAVARAAIASKQAIAQAWASAPFPANLGVVATTLAKTGVLTAAINAIKPIGQAHDGIMSVPKSGTWNLEKGERVLPKHTAKALDDKLNSMGSGGQTVIVNVTVNSDGTASVDSQAQMGKQMGEAIKVAVQQEMMKQTRQGGLLYGR